MAVWLMHSAHVLDGNAVTDEVEGNVWPLIISAAWAETVHATL